MNSRTPTHSLNRALNVKTLSESGMLFHALKMREAQEKKRLRRQQQIEKVRTFLFNTDFSKSLKDLAGRALAKMTYSLWQKGYFSSFDEFTTPRSA